MVVKPWPCCTVPPAAAFLARHADEPCARGLQTCPPLRGKRVGQHPRIAERLCRAPRRRVKDRASVACTIRAASCCLHRDSVIDAPANGPARNQDAYQFLAIV